MSKMTVMYQEEECLWNVDSTKYFNSEKKRRALRKISQSLLRACEFDSRF